MNNNIIQAKDPWESIDRSIAPIKTSIEIIKLQTANQIASSVLEEMSRYVRPGISIEELDALGRKFIEKHHAQVDRYAVGGNLSDKYALSFGINDVFFYHPIDKTILKNGDLLNMDCSIQYDGWAGDVGRSWIVGGVGSYQVHKLHFVAYTTTWLAITLCKPGAVLNDIAKQVNDYVKSQGCSMIDFQDWGSVVGMGKNHSIGHVHNDGWLFTLFPSTENEGRILEEGMTLSIEPGISNGNGIGIPDIVNSTAGRMADGHIATYWEHIIAITKTGCSVLDLRPGESIPTYEEIMRTIQHS